MRQVPIIAVATLLAASAGAGASTLQLEPVSIRLTPQQRTAVVQLRNGGREPIHVQVRAYRWGQDQGQDLLSPTSDLRVSPPIQSIAPGTEQIVRVLLAEGLQPLREETFRLVVDELPRAAAPDARVQMLIRYSVPVIVRPAGLAPHDLEFRLRYDGGQAVLEALNRGGHSAQLVDVQFTTADGDSIRVNEGLYGYVLAGQARLWPLLLSPASIERATGIQAQVDGTANRYRLEVAH